VHATIDLVDVQVDIAAESSASQARATFDMTSFHSGNAHRDKDIRNRFFRANEHPTMKFTSTELRLGADGRWELLGRLEYRAACEITLVLTSLEADGAGFRAQGTATVDRYGCGVTKGRGLIGRWVEVTDGYSVVTPVLTCRTAGVNGRMAGGCANRSSSSSCKARKKSCRKWACTASPSANSSHIQMRSSSLGSVATVYSVVPGSPSSSVRA
jgi:hypothetical protein